MIGADKIVDIDILKEWKVEKKDPNTVILRAESDTASFELDEILTQIDPHLSEKKKNISFNVTINRSTFTEVIITTSESTNSTKKYKRLYTSGCYDLFHYGHLNIFKKSKELCEQLIVGVSTDELIEREKGARPVIPYEERAKIVEAIKYVDEVIPQEDKNKQKIVDKYKIDAISVGDDWKGKYPPVTCEMVYFPYTKSVSSTILKDTLSLLKS